MRESGHLRDTQIEAIETYLFLKIKGGNKPLWQLFSEGFFKNGTDLDRLNINQAARAYLAEHPEALALYDFARQPLGKGQLIPNLVQEILERPGQLDYERIIRAIFYNVSYADYLMSLPMGAGKTFLMAAFIYLDLYFADSDPDNKNFAHNFLVLVPSGLKSSIVPSLRTIQNFDPSWVLPEPAASRLKRLLKFDVLDEAKTSKKSNKARNPNAQKVNACLPNPFGQVFVVNAEKVVLDSLPFDAQLKLDVHEIEKDTHNDLKWLFGQIPNMSILIDEVHHAASDDIKLRQAVNYWQTKGNITTVLGFSGTPYLSSAEIIPVGDFAFKFGQITNTVYFYPLVTAIQKFLKTPTIKTGNNLDRLQLIEQGIQDFDQRYRDFSYPGGVIPKLAIYCSNIETLEEEVFPFLTGTLHIDPAEILKYHGGNSKYKLPKENELEFRSLDQATSRKRYILLVQVGKEGWDCPSLTGVILSQKGDCPKNMVLQTACRCLRQVEKGSYETALIWLNQDNAATLNEQLKKEQMTSIQELNDIKRGGDEDLVPRYSRMAFLQLPAVDFYQLQVNYRAVATEGDIQPAAKLHALLEGLSSYRDDSYVSTSTLMEMEAGDISVLGASGRQLARFHDWLFEISRESLGSLALAELWAHEAVLRTMFAQLSFERGGERYFDERYDRDRVQSRIRLAFVAARALETEQEVIPQQASLLLLEKLHSVQRHDKLFPATDQEVKDILDRDKRPEVPTLQGEEALAKYEQMKASLEAAGLGNMVESFEQFSARLKAVPSVSAKDRSFHYLPYDFGQSGFELNILQKALSLDTFQQHGLEIYYNGERGLTGFVIQCFAKEGRYWKNIGRYTPDFLILRRDSHDKIHKALILETKGAGFAHDPVFQQKRRFMETTFLSANQDKFGYARFDFLYLEDSQTIGSNIAQLSDRITQFFNA